MKTKNKKRTGDYYERKYIKKLEELGWICFKPVRTKFSKQKDIFNLFDGVCWHPREGTIMFFQVKKNKNEYTQETLKKLEKFVNSLKTLAISAVYFKGGKPLYILLKWMSIEQNKQFKRLRDALEELIISLGETSNSKYKNG